MKDQLEQKTQYLIQHADEIAGYSCSGVLCSAPVWVGTLTDWLQLLAVLVGILVGFSTYQLNQTKKKKLDEQKRK